MPILTERDITIAIVKATTSQIPVIGPFISEGIGALDQRATIDLLEQRLQQIEKVLLDHGLVAFHLSGNPLLDFTHTANYEFVLTKINAASLSESAFEEFFTLFSEPPMADYEQLCFRERLSVVHALLRKCEHAEFTLSENALNTLISLATDVLTNVTAEDDSPAYFKELPDGTNKPIGCLAEAWHSLGIHLMRAQQFINAIRCFMRSIEFGAEPHYPLLNIANSFLGLGHLRYAIDKYQVLVQIYPYSLPSRYRLASALAMNNDYDKAAVHYRYYVEEFDRRAADGLPIRPEYHDERLAAITFLENLTS